MTTPQQTTAPRNRAAATNRVYFETLLLYLVMFGALLLLRFVASRGFTADAVVLYVAIFVIVGWCQFSLTHALHEYVHYNFGRHHLEALGALLTVYPVGLTRCYRYVHFEHHRYFGRGERDPDYESYAPFPASKVELVGRLLRNLLGFTAVRQFFGQKPVNHKCNVLFENACLCAVQAVLLLAIGGLVAWWAYPLFWVLPIMTIGKLCSSTRALCEHGSPEGPVLRTITGNLAQTLVLGMFNFNYHAEHHHHPSVPYTGLPTLHAERGNEEQLADRIPEERYEHGYVALLCKWFFRLPLTRREGTAHG